MSKNVVPCGGFELGDSLEIKDGKLDLVDGAGGGLPTLIVNISLDDSSNFVADKTYQEIINAYKDNKQVIAVFREKGTIFYLSQCPDEISTYVDARYISFFTVLAKSGSIIIGVLELNSAENITTYSKTIS